MEALNMPRCLAGIIKIFSYIAHTVLVWVGEGRFGTIGKIIAGETVVDTENSLQLLVATVTIPKFRLLLVMMTEINNN